MEPAHRESAEILRRSIAAGHHDPVVFRAALLGVPPSSRDAWCDLVLDLPELPEDSALPHGCVPYLPCSIDALLRVIEQTPVTSSDVFVDLGSGPGRATTLVHLLTGATAIGIEIQPALVGAARDLAARLQLARVSCLEGDAATLVPIDGTVFFLYCPFGGDRLAGVLDDLIAIARTRSITVCSLDLPLSRLAPNHEDGNLAFYRSSALSAA